MKKIFLHTTNKTAKLQRQKLQNPRRINHRTVTLGEESDSGTCKHRVTRDLLRNNFVHQPQVQPGARIGLTGGVPEEALGDDLHVPLQQRHHVLRNGSVHSRRQQTLLGAAQRHGRLPLHRVLHKLVDVVRASHERTARRDGRLRRLRGRTAAAAAGGGDGGRERRGLPQRWHEGGDRGGLLVDGGSAGRVRGFELEELAVGGEGAAGARDGAQRLGLRGSGGLEVGLRGDVVVGKLRVGVGVEVARVDVLALVGAVGGILLTVVGVVACVLASESGVPVVLDGVVCAAREHPRDGRPLVAVDAVRCHDRAVLFLCWSAES